VGRTLKRQAAILLAVFWGKLRLRDERDHGAEQIVLYLAVLGHTKHAGTNNATVDINNLSETGLKEVFSSLASTPGFNTHDAV
jgi:hypothetical protein